MTTKKKGDRGELIAIEYLQRKGYQIIDSNFKFSRFGEIDIIAKKSTQTYFIEVKYRNNTAYGEPEESISKTKLMKLKKTMQYYILKNNLDFEYVQFDIITLLKLSDSYRLKHYKNIEI